MNARTSQDSNLDVGRAFQTIQYTETDSIATITLDRPAQRNAIDAVMRTELGQVISAIRQNRGIKVLILQGAGDAFCAGGDIGAMAENQDAEQARDRMVSLQGIIRDLLCMDKIIVAAVHGGAYGAGLGLALTADLILATPQARFCLSFLRLGAVPDCGVFYTLTRIVGPRVAKQLALSTREIDAAQAREMGIVYEIHENDQIATRASDIAQRLSVLPAASLGMTKKIFDSSLDSSLDAVLEMEAIAQGIARSTEFHHDSVERFKRKDPFVYQGL